jgi:hypothetical protein
MRILRFAGVFTVAKRLGKCGRKTSKLHVSQQVSIGVCYRLGVLSENLFSFSEQNCQTCVEVDKLFGWFWFLR